MPRGHFRRSRSTIATPRFSMRSTTCGRAMRMPISRPKMPIYMRRSMTFPIPCSRATLPAAARAVRAMSSVTSAGTKISPPRSTNGPTLTRRYGADAPSGAPSDRDLDLERRGDSTRPISIWPKRTIGASAVAAVERLPSAPAPRPSRRPPGGTRGPAPARRSSGRLRDYDEEMRIWRRERRPLQRADRARDRACGRAGAGALVPEQPRHDHRHPAGLGRQRASLHE